MQRLNPDLLDGDFRFYKKELKDRIIGQDVVIDKLVQAFQIASSGLALPDRPLGIFLLLGPTGTGKTHTVETASKVYLERDDALLKVDCSEFQLPHEISKLIGSPPGYVGHEKTPPRFTQDIVSSKPFLLFDEIEKANESLRQIMLGIMDKGTVTLGNNETVYFSNSYVFMTSNIGASDIQKELSGQTLGFVSASENKSIEDISISSLKKAFSPEFINRIDHVVTFNPLTKKSMYAILDNELRELQKRIMGHGNQTKFYLDLKKSAKDYLVENGFDKNYGARSLKRVIDRNLVFPLSKLLATYQIEMGDRVVVGVNKGKVTFHREPGALLLKDVRTPVRSSQNLPAVIDTKYNQ